MPAIGFHDGAWVVEHDLSITVSYARQTEHTVTVFDDLTEESWSVDVYGAKTIEDASRAVADEYAACDHHVLLWGMSDEHEGRIVVGS